MRGESEDIAGAVAALGGARRINVIGTSGTGKTTFSRSLAEVLGLPLQEMDRLYWLQDWTDPEEEVFLAKVREAVSGGRWVLDGNYNRTSDIKWASVECVVWLDYPFLTTLRQAVFRAFRRSLTQEEIWPGTGNRESFRKSFLSGDSIILWTLKTYRSNRERYREAMAEAEGRRYRFIRIGSAAAAAEVLRHLRERGQ